MPRKKREYIVTTIRVSKDVHEAVVALAEEEERTINSMLVYLLKLGMERFRTVNKNV